MNHDTPADREPHRPALHMAANHWHLAFGTPPPTGPAPVDRSPADADSET
ncbi:hypothetical protein [Kitasatospora cineracea]